MDGRQQQAPVQEFKAGNSSRKIKLIINYQYFNTIFHRNNKEKIYERCKIT